MEGWTMKWSPSTLQRRALADAYALRGRKGLHKTVAGWSDPNSVIDFYPASTIHSLVDRGLLQFWVSGTVVHVTDHGAELHEALLEQERRL
jgi:hypothetical protein